MIRERGIEKHLTGLIMPIKSPTDLFPANQKLKGNNNFARWIVYDKTNNTIIAKNEKEK